ncbi:CD209 antigen-like protein D isoform X2 [Mus caroli]|uniref:CD209 antigen-like protein D isoform X2 n=1 Tax=Mus caroli TaxID=10089 RepID=A0A6P5QF52_MUSCR|nr:CD209 antigen-like protein D isoform X2 [Mus caroli]
MSDSTESKTQQVGIPEDEECLMSGTRYSDISSRLRTKFGIKSLAVSKVPSSEVQNKIYQELMQLKAEVHDGLCQPCPRDWTFFNGSCYFFSKSQRNWNNSITACQELGAQLVIIETDEEQTFLQQTSKARGPTWMGLSDMHNEATWHWVDGSPLSPSFTQYWNRGEPNNVGDEDCAEFSGNGWNDLRCDNSLFWICKKVSTSSCTTK